MDATLFRWSYDYVGDLAETVALVWPQRPGANREPEQVANLVMCSTVLSFAWLPVVLAWWM